MKPIVANYKVRKERNINNEIKIITDRVGRRTGIVLEDKVKRDDDLLENIEEYWKIAAEKLKLIENRGKLNKEKLTEKLKGEGLSKKEDKENKLEINRILESLEIKENFKIYPKSQKVSEEKAIICENNIDSDKLYLNNSEFFTETYQNENSKINIEYPEDNRSQNQSLLIEYNHVSSSIPTLKIFENSPIIKEGELNKKLDKVNIKELNNNEFKINEINSKLWEIPKSKIFNMEQDNLKDYKSMKIENHVDLENYDNLDNDLDNEANLSGNNYDEDFLITEKISINELDKSIKSENTEKYQISGFQNIQNYEKSQNSPLNMDYNIQSDDLIENCNNINQKVENEKKNSVDPIRDSISIANNIITLPEVLSISKRKRGRPRKNEASLKNIKKDDNIDSDIFLPLKDIQIDSNDEKMEFGLRRSKRTKFKPLRYWCNERIVYKTKNIGNGIKVPTAVGIIKSLDVEKNYRSNSAVKTKEILENQGYKLVKDAKGPVIDINTKNETIHRLLVNLEVQPLANNPNDSYIVIKSPENTLNAGFGLLILPVSGIKPNSSSGFYHLRFFVIDGIASTTVHKTTFISGPGAEFIIPPCNQYEIKNTGTRVAKLYYSKVREVNEIRN